MCFLWPLAVASVCNLIEAYLLERWSLEKALQTHQSCKYVRMPVSGCWKSEGWHFRISLSGRWIWRPRGKFEFWNRGNRCQAGVSLGEQRTRLRDWGFLLFLLSHFLVKACWFPLTALVASEMKHCYEFMLIHRRLSFVWFHETKELFICLIL